MVRDCTCVRLWYQGKKKKNQKASMIMIISFEKQKSENHFLSIYPFTSQNYFTIVIHECNQCTHLYTSRERHIGNLSWHFS